MRSDWLNCLVSTLNKVSDTEAIVIVDYGMGNIRSISKVLQGSGVATTVSSDPASIVSARKLILPGVGHFGQAMRNLRQRGLIEALHEAVTQREIPILGICLGMQLMARYSAEGNEEGLGWFDGSVVRLKVPDSARYKVPHIGWNEVESVKSSVLTADIDSAAEFYFLHSFCYETQSPEEILMTTAYGCTFASAIEKGAMYGVQFHPEKSHDVGALLLKNFAGA